MEQVKQVKNTFSFDRHGRLGVGAALAAGATQTYAAVDG